MTKEELKIKEKEILKVIYFEFNSIILKKKNITKSTVSNILFKVFIKYNYPYNYSVIDKECIFYINRKNKIIINVDIFKYIRNQKLKNILK